MNPAVVGGVEDLHEAVAVEVGDDGVGEHGLDHAGILRERAAARPGRGEHGPVETVTAPARPVEVEDERRVIKAGVVAAVEDVADDNQLGNTVTVDVGDDGRTGAEVGTALDRAVGVTSEVRRLVDVDTDLAPDLSRGVEAVHGELVPVSVQAHDVVRATRTENLLETVAVHVGHGHVLVVHAPAEARLAVAARGPAGTNRAVGLEDGELTRPRPGSDEIGPARDDLEPAGILQIGEGQRARLAAAAEGVPCPDDVAEAVVDGEPVGVAADDHF